MGTLHPRQQVSSHAEPMQRKVSVYVGHRSGVFDTEPPAGGPVPQPVEKDKNKQALARDGPFAD